MEGGRVPATHRDTHVEVVAGIVTGNNGISRIAGNDV